MNGKTLLMGLGQISDRYVEEASQEAVSRRVPQNWKPWTAAACLGAVVVWGVWGGGRNPFRFASGENTVIHLETAQDTGSAPGAGNAGTFPTAAQQTASMIVRIDAITAEGFVGTVVEPLESADFAPGTTLTVELAQGVHLEIPAEQEKTQGSAGEGGYPAIGNLVEVGYTSWEDGRVVGIWVCIWEEQE